MNTKLITGADALRLVNENFRDGIGPELWRTPDPQWNSFEVGPGLIAIIAAPPKTGKTALSMQIVADALACNPSLKAYIANCELSPYALMMRLLARASGIPAADLRFGLRSKDDIERLEMGVKRLGAIADRLIFYAGPFAMDAITRTFSDAGVGGGLLVVDYLQRLRLVSGESPHDTRIELESVMSAMRGLADAGLGIIGISAVARQKGKGGSDYQGIGLASLRGSSELEYGADSVWLLHGGGGGDDARTAALGETMMSFECAANRHGDIAQIPLIFEKKRMAFHIIGGGAQ